MRTFLIRYERNAMKISRYLNLSSHDVLNIRGFNEETIYAISMNVYSLYLENELTVDFLKR